MTESSNNNYNAADFERYHAGKMSAAEMHALEKAAMEDPFLADALEGFVFTPTPQNDLELIRTKLFGEKKEEKAAPVIRRNFNWLKAAAIIIFIAGGTWLAFQVTSTKKTGTDIATQKLEDKKPSITDTTQKTDFSTAITQTKQDSLNLTTVASAGGNRQKTISDSLSTRSFGAFLSSTRDSVTITNDLGLAIQMPPAAVTDSVKFYNTQNDVAYNKDMVNMSATNANNATSKMPLPGYNNTYKPAKRKDNEAESFKMKESNAKANDDTITNLNIVLQPDNAELSEVVVSTNKKQAVEERKFELKVDTLEPEVGWNKFDEYIARNIQVPDELKSKKQTYSGEVELEFDINKKGEPVNITVTKSLCNKCDEEAIRLLKEGPKWKKKKVKKGKVTIRF